MADLSNVAPGPAQRKPGRNANRARGPVLPTIKLRGGAQNVFDGTNSVSCYRGTGTGCVHASAVRGKSQPCGLIWQNRTRCTHRMRDVKYSHHVTNIRTYDLEPRANAASCCNNPRPVTPALMRHSKQRNITTSSNTCYVHGNRRLRVTIHSMLSLACLQVLGGPWVQAWLHTLPPQPSSAAV